MFRAYGSKKNKIKHQQNLSTIVYNKPAGQGTGLGLSLSYDIIKAHGGEIKVKTKEGEEAEFIITLQQNF